MVTANKSALLAQAQGRAHQALPGLQQRYDALESSLRHTAATANRRNDNDQGLLAQLQALSELDGRDPALRIAHLTVAALFFLIEILPVTVKILLNLGPMTAYKVVAETANEQTIDSARARRLEARQIEEGRSRVRVNVENDMRVLEEDLGKKANKRVAGEMTAVLDAALHEWGRQVRARLSGWGQQGQARQPHQASGTAGGVPGPASGPTAGGGPASGAQGLVNGASAPVHAQVSPILLPDIGDL